MLSSSIKVRKEINKVPNYKITEKPCRQLEKEGQSKLHERNGIYKVFTFNYKTWAINRAKQ